MDDSDDLMIALLAGENLIGRRVDDSDPMATYDFAWMWQELAIEELRR